MLDFPADIKHESKCHVTHGILGHVDPKQPPVKRKPFVAISNHNFVQRAELILPQELFESIRKHVFEENERHTYHRVIMPLKAILEGQFFNEYIKKGDILMLSEGRIGIDNVYSIKEGILTLHLDRESYERAGIVGKPDGVKGKRGTKPWWVVEINLRLPSMLHGKKGFDRILYAFKNVLVKPVTWLFLDLGKTALTPDPLEAHFPVKKVVSVQVSENILVNMPSLDPPKELDASYSAEFDDYAVETLEWLSMVLLNSPRLEPTDQIDPFLCRYAPPGILTERKLAKISWQGFLSPSWAYRNFVDLLLTMPREAWFAYHVVGFEDRWLGDGKNSTVLKLPYAPSEYVLWEIA